MASAQSSPSPAGAALPQKHPLRVHPPRSLQHSPSLPNIWFPPHRGPLPDQFKNGIAREHLHQPTTPPALSQTFPLPLSPSKPRQKSESPSAVETPKAEVTQLPDLARDRSPTPRRSYADKQTRFQQVARHIKSDTRSRVDRQHSHKLLTPPLTPSSSIRTAGSSDSAVTDLASEAADSHGQLDVDEQSKATRFLLVGNILRNSDSGFLTSCFATALTKPNLRDLLPFPDASPESSKTTDVTAKDSPVAGIYVRYVKCQGLIIVAFHDIRYSIAAKRLLSTRYTDVLDTCLESPGTQWFTCSFLSTKQLYDMTGDHKYVAAGTADFYISLENLDRPLVDAEDVNNGQLINVLRSYGAIHAWEPVECLNGDDSPNTYRVEYCDIGDARKAYAALYGVTLCGRRVILRGMDDFHEVDLSLPCGSSGVAPSVVPSPRAQPSHTSSTFTHFSRPGDKSLIRDRFVFPNSTDSSHRLSNDDDDDATLVSSDNTVQSSSPTFFYTSPPGPTSSHVDPTSGRNQASSQNYISDHTDAVVDEASQVTRSDPDGAVYPQHQSSYYPHPSYYTAHGEYGMVGYPASSPPMQYPQSPTLMYPGCHTPPFGYDESQLMAGMNGVSLNNCRFDPSVPFTNSLFSHPTASYCSVAPEFFQPRGPPPEMANVPYYNSPEAISEQPGAYLVPTPDHTESSGAPSDGHVRYRGSLKKRSTGSSATAEQALKNQLDLVSIENGVDTRTTVMIKNIPNKMSDRDLIYYINKVKPRRIDFLYLRMDFANGCNVGYAFVNFIEVQDLLYFAKKRLGQKWNMFSSDKVLQMSYANYQGKEALVEKFKNSCIMDEQEAWQPKIFYSNGPNQGLAEPFPAPTHMRRKERSLHNRGNLFPPGSSTFLNAPRSNDSEDRTRHGERRSRFRMTESLSRHLLSAGGKDSRVF